MTEPRILRPVVKKRPASALSNGSPPITETSSGSSSTETGTAPSTPSVSLPWSPVKKITDKQGLVFSLFGPPGAGKSTLGASATSSVHGRELLILNFDNDLRSLQDREDLMAWPGEKDNGKIRSWEHASSFLATLAQRTTAGKHPFKTIQFDTVNSMYDFAYKHVIAKGGPNRDGRQIWGEANDLVLEVVSQWASLAKDTGINVVFVCHSEEKQDGENGPIVLRMAVTPGVVKGMYQRVSTIGCLLEMPGGKRKLYLHNTAKIVAKVHQPQSGNKLPLEISDPNLGRMIEHVKGIRPYPTKERP